MTTKQRTPKNTGYILHETSDFVVIVTTKSRNRKTADMKQIWILARNVSPVAAVKSGQDELVCFDCQHRGINGAKRTCYVNYGQAPNSIWEKYQRGGYPVLSPADYASVFGSMPVRFGAYGEPVLIPVDIMAAIARVCGKRTGYTHQWRRPEYQVYREYLMASCDSEHDFTFARAMGWRTFRVRGTYDALLANEIICPASDEGNHKTTCERCGLCDGARTNDARKNIAIIVHGIGSKNFVTLGEILPAAF